MVWLVRFFVFLCYNATITAVRTVAASAPAAAQLQIFLCSSLVDFTHNQRKGNNDIYKIKMRWWYRSMLLSFLHLFDSLYKIHFIFKTAHTFRSFTAVYRFLLIFLCICQMHSHSIKEQKRSCETENKITNKCLNINMAHWKKKKKNEHKYVAVQKSFDTEKMNKTKRKKKFSMKKACLMFSFGRSVFLCSYNGFFFFLYSFHSPRRFDIRKANIGNWQKSRNKRIRTGCYLIRCARVAN